MARPDERVLFHVDGYQFKKAKQDGHVFITTPEGVNVTVHVNVLKSFLSSVESDADLSQQFGLR
ncbi:hypothetical protein JCM19037_133 [Geomicrobium sp. JCM 19037]|uniref:hypothetical protein n=1 Tax=Geomicrobium sp. JCM 19037 TaxID=1460634 RepID=UPI00045F350B|nr:hypothetical protein [Geomicrobium sp. JCM 19037]GAK01937.1 hypothetical protein JCM19037_133 [Geomicrobium sp. JCM 19037]